ncbi:MAG: DUF6159 family protein [Micromonosporaceae bacterium]
MTEPSDPYQYGPSGQGQPPYGQAPYGQAPYGQAPYGAYAGYGAPMPQPGAAPTGRQVLTACWALLRQDRSLLALPVIAMVAGLVAAAVLFVPGWAAGSAIGGSSHTGAEVGAVLAAFAASVVSIYFQAALVIGANERADGGTPTLGGVLRQTAKLMRPVLAWALVATTVGMAIRIAEQRLGVIGKIAGFLGGLAWAIATFLAVPVVVAEGLGPIAAVKRSAELIRTTWGTSLRTTLRFGLIQFALILPLLAAGVIGVTLLFLGTAGAVLGALLIAIAVLGLFAMSAVFSAISSYARAMIYRYATGRPVPGIPAEAFAGVFTPKRGRR